MAGKNIKIYFPAIAGNQVKFSDNGQMQTLKWIHVEFQLYNKNELPPDIVKSVAKETANIIESTVAYFDSNEKFLGCTNSYLGQDNLYLDSIPGDKKATPHHISKDFYPSIIKADIGWNIEIRPLKIEHQKDVEIDLYTLHNLYRDMWILIASCEYIEKKIGMPPQTDFRYEPFLVEKTPCIRLYERFVVTEYDMPNRLYHSRMFPDLDKYVLGNGLATVEDLIQQIRKNYPNSQWIKYVDELISKDH